MSSVEFVALYKPYESNPTPKDRSMLALYWVLHARNVINKDTGGAVP